MHTIKLLTLSYLCIQSAHSFVLAASTGAPGATAPRTITLSRQTTPVRPTSQRALRPPLSIRRTPGWSWCKKKPRSRTNTRMRRGSPQAGACRPPRALREWPFPSTRDCGYALPAARAYRRQRPGTAPANQGAGAIIDSAFARTWGACRWGQ